MAKFQIEYSQPRKSPLLLGGPVWEKRTETIEAIDDTEARQIAEAFLAKGSLKMEAGNFERKLNSLIQTEPIYRVVADYLPRRSRAA